MHNAITEFETVSAWGIRILIKLSSSFTNVSDICVDVIVEPCYV